MSTADDDKEQLERLGPPCAAGCGGYTRVKPWPEHASGCACAVRATAASQRDAIERIAQAGSLKPELIARINDGTFEP